MVNGKEAYDYNGPYESPLLNLREMTHGNYPDTARMSQFLKHYLREQPGWEKLSAGQQESLDMIVVKIARILSGDPNEKDHWLDIAGYASLVSGRA